MTSTGCKDFSRSFFFGGSNGNGPGALTTFSTFGPETVGVFQGGRYLVSAADMPVNKVSAPLLVFWGLVVGRRR
jgi:fluoride ion exporter CrcB/FEX